MKSAVVLSLLTGAALALPASSNSNDASSLSVAGAPLSKVSMGKKHTVTRSNGKANLPGFFASLNNTLIKYGKTPLPYYAPVAEAQEVTRREMKEEKEKRRRRRRGNETTKKRQANEPLTDQYEGDSEDAAYYGAVVVGADDGNPQTFELIFDTGSSDIWVPGPDCGIAAGCPHFLDPKYDGGGTALGTNTSIQYGSGSTEGANYIDDVTVAGLTSPNQTFFAVTTAYGFEEIDADGICGMAFTSIAQDNGTTFFENLVNQGTVSTAEFGVYLGRVASGTEDDSELTLGGRDSTKYLAGDDGGNFTTVPVTQQTYWQVALDRVTVDGASAGVSTPGQAAIDTGTTVVLAPTTAAREIMAKIPGTFGFSLEGEKLYLFPCNTSDAYIPAIEFAGTSFQINPLDFSIGAVSEEDIATLALGNTAVMNEIESADIDLSDYCIAGLAGGDVSETENLYVVGDTFIKNWYAVFSYTANEGAPAVLFAPSIGQES